MAVLATINISVGGAWSDMRIAMAGVGLMMLISIYLAGMLQGSGAAIAAEHATMIIGIGILGVVAGIIGASLA